MRICFIALLITISAQAWANNDITNNKLVEATAAIDANVIFMRHALAPGFGDPEDFNVADCSTQRNLNEKGRAQALSTVRQCAIVVYNLEKYYLANGAGAYKQLSY